VLGTSTGTASDFHSAWLIGVGGGLSAGVALAALGAPARRAAASAPVVAEAAAADAPLVGEAAA